MRRVIAATEAWLRRYGLSFSDGSMGRQVSLEVVGTDDRPSAAAIN